MSTKLVFWKWFATGVVLVLLNTEFLLGRVQFVSIILDVLTIPGILLSIPLHNALASPIWVIGVMSCTNGLVYGLVARWIARRRERH